MEKKIKKHGMTTEKARRVKQRGHKKEFIYAQIIKGEVVRGTKKEDVKDSNGKIHSLKGGSEIQKKSGRHGKWQIFLYKKSRFEQEMTFAGRELILDILNTFPLTHQEYEEKKKEVKEKVKKPMIKLKEYLLDEENRFNFFNKSFFDERVDFFVIYDDEAFYVFDKEETINAFVNFLEVDNNSTLQKVVFKYNNRLVAEFEYRTTDDGKYPAMLFNMQKRQAFDLLTEKIFEKKVLNPVLVAYGKAIKYFENYRF
ncbi:hypothetical protein COU58_03865 [Candidatus Pacearchaeota archaeon CG10_big_fil_rev_8_21_14_0_10_32_42]|nr:MAG: hypothetical protein COU58_03865 [Candidatus Pacearchaeota archaeon CG10_big_fil_rev_8_21_14_0_10_32_42]